MSKRKQPTFTSPPAVDMQTLWEISREAIMSEVQIPPYVWSPPGEVVSGSAPEKEVTVVTNGGTAKDFTGSMGRITPRPSRHIKAAEVAQPEPLTRAARAKRESDPEPQVEVSAVSEPPYRSTWMEDAFKRLKTTDRGFIAAPSTIPYTIRLADGTERNLARPEPIPWSWED